MTHDCTRRDFLALAAGGCAAHLALAARLAPDGLARFARARREVVAAEPFGRLERVADGVWALVSTPLAGDRTTLSNGGIVAGRNGVLAVEGFNQPAGAAWLADQARRLTGRWPTHVVVTHYHADHANGVAGYVADGERAPAVHATARTRDLALAKNLPADPSRTAALRDAVVLQGNHEEIDLGDRIARLVPRDGHTPSDTSVELDDPAVVFAGDLVWNGMFPNYVDAVPSRLAAAVRALRREDARTTYVPGHGAVATHSDVDRYLDVLGAVEDAARHAHAAGNSAADAGAAFALPAALGEWTLFNKVFFERAFAAWYAELNG